MGAQVQVVTRVPRWAQHAALAVVLVAACALGRSVHLPSSHVALVWPATGVVVLWAAAEERWSRRAVVLGAAAVLAAAVCQPFGLDARTTLASTLPTVATPAVVLAVTERLQGGRLQLHSSRDLWALVAGAATGGVAGALSGPFIGAAGAGLPDPAVVGGWAVSASASVLVVVAVGMRLRQQQERTPGTAGPVEQVALLVTGAASCVGVFVLTEGVQVAFLVLPAAVWAALRLRTRGSALHLGAGAMVVLVGTLDGRGPFAPFPLAGGLVLAHLFIGVLTTVVLSISLHRDELARLASRLDAALAEARDQRGLLEAVHAAVGDGIIVYAADGSGLLSNPAADRLVGPNPRRDRPSAWEGVYTFTRPDGTPVATADLPVPRALAGEDVVGCDLLVTSSLSPLSRVLSTAAHPLPDVPGAAWSRGAVAVFHDVTREREEAAAAARTRDLLAGVLDGATEQGVFATGPDHHITVFSSGAERLLGWSAAEVVGQTPGRFLRLAEVFERAAEAGLPPGPEVVLHGLAEHGHTTRRWTLVRRDGSVFTAEMTLTQLLDEDGAAVGSVAVFVDVTGRIAAAQRLADSEEQFRLAFETAPTGMVVVGLEAGRTGRITRVNDAFAAFTGRSRADLLDLEVRDVLHPDDVPGHTDRLRRIAAGEAPAAGGLEQRFSTGSGTGAGVRWGRTSASLIQPSDGSAPHLLVVVEDVTERHASQEALRRAALHDPLTGLPNRTLLSDRLERALTADRREQAGVTVLFTDLDGFKPVNDEHGHAAGDALLRVVAERLVAAVRPGDTVARLGGDEFAVVCPRLPAEAVAELLERVDAAVSAPVVLPGGAVVRVGASTGTATAVGGDEAFRLLDEADHRMYAVKRRRRGPGRGRGPVRPDRTGRPDRTDVPDRATAASRRVVPVPMDRV